MIEVEPRTYVLDGRNIVVRGLEPTDRDGIARFLRGLSTETMYRRFFSLPRVDDRLLDLVAWADHRCQESIVALDGDDVVGLASYERCQCDDGAADVAIVVGDDWQHHGLGTVLMRVLGGVAHRRGVDRFTASMLADNRPVVDFVHRTAPTARLRFDGGGELSMDLPLTS
ncbi:MAG TPA: GNAT family N-acetyltransferase [Acidimicrobiales bacterium]|nr:GNAT family N-acetyltransferase [Acidimicrobiales bacterium]